MWSLRRAIHAILVNSTLPDIQRVLIVRLTGRPQPDGPLSHTILFILLIRFLRFGWRCLPDLLFPEPRSPVSISPNAPDTNLARARVCIQQYDRGDQSGADANQPRRIAVGTPICLKYVEAGEDGDEYTREGEYD